jgi:hypothetical protein
MYTMNFAIRRALSLDMQGRSPERFRAIISVALAIHAERLQSAKVSPERSVISLIEVVYHSFKALEADPKARAKARDLCRPIQRALKQYLPLFLAHLKEDDRPTCLPMLRTYWRADEELKETAQRVSGGTRCHESLTRQIEEFVEDPMRESGLI